MFKREMAAYLKPVRWYVLIALVLNLGIMLIWKYKDEWDIGKTDLLYSNNFLYNIHSITRLVLFSLFFILLKKRFMHRIKMILPALFIALAVINFIFFEDFFNRNLFSTRMLAIEAGILLFYCLQYYIFLNLEERTGTLNQQKGFWVVTGLFIFVAACFFIFLFYSYLTAADKKFAVDIWDVHNLAYIILGICLAISFKKNR
jgi:hypothetical protein